MSNLTPQELVSLGEKIYFDKKEELERDHNGEFAVIDAESGNIVVNSDKLTAVEEARSKYPNKLFYIVQIGRLREQSGSEISEAKKYGWAI